MLEVGFGDLLVALFLGILVNHRHRWFGENRQRRHDDVELVGAALFFQGQEGFVFPGQQYVALTVVDEGNGRAASAGVQHWHVLEQGLYVFLGLGFVAAIGFQAIGPGREEVPARTAGGFRVRRDHRDVILDQVAPVLDAFRVALAHQEHDGRGVRRAGVRQAFLPVGRQGFAELGDFVDITGQGQGHDVGTQAIDHRPTLLARTAVGLLDFHGVTGVVLLPELDEFGVVVLIQLAGRVVRHVEQLVVLGNGGTGKKGAGQGGQSEMTNRRHGESSWNSWFVGFFLWDIALPDSPQPGLLPGCCKRNFSLRSICTTWALCTVISTAPKRRSRRALWISRRMVASS
ncbi:hypothetical protein D3C86_1382920 [compost metagenome]